MVKLVIESRTSDLGGFSVRRTLPSRLCKQVGPWVFFDHMGPAEFAPGEGLNVRPHPHVGLATVTFLFAGEALHRDSLGNTQIIEPGAINLMVAGRGIVHSERERDEVKNQPHRSHGLQLWLALPEADEEMPPAFFHYPAQDFAPIALEAGHARVLMGEAFGTCSPVKTFAETLYVEVHLPAGASLTLPDAEQRAVYIICGELEIDGEVIPSFNMAVLEAGAARVQAHQDSHFALIGGERLSRRYIDWNFVSSRRERLQQARDDWQAGRFPKVPGDEHEYIPLPEG